MSRGYFRGLIIGGILGVAIGKILKSREERKDLFLERKDDNLDDFDLDKLNFSEEKYQDYYSHYQEEDEVEDYEKKEEKLVNKIAVRGRRKKPTRLSLNREKRKGSLE